MGKHSFRFVCQACGAVTGKWAGKCDACGEWNSISEEAPAAASAGGMALPKGRAAPLLALAGDEPVPDRLVCGLDELDRVSGGGLVPGSAVLIGGDPGIGKSTLLLQLMAHLAQAGERVVYVSGEEAIGQIRLRAERLGLSKSPLMLMAETNIADIIAGLGAEPAPAVVVIDSIQTLWSPAVESAPGTVSQLRTAAEALIRFAKSRDIAVLLVGHVTKDGQIAGPKVIEHMVDTVLYFEGDRGHHFRILRAVKNRFGPTNEIGVFEMSDRGLQPVANPSHLLMGNRDTATPGAAIFAGIEGTRPLLMEVQALVSPSVLATPRRAVVGWDQNRLAMILAVLETHAGIKIGAQDVYLSVAGGIKLREPAADLAVAAALVSSLSGRPLPSQAVFCGEIALSGAVRPVGQIEQRLKEAARMGLQQGFIAAESECAGSGLALKQLADVAALCAHAMTQAVAA